MKQGGKGVVRQQYHINDKIYMRKYHSDGYRGARFSWYGEFPPLRQLIVFAVYDKNGAECLNIYLDGNQLEHMGVRCYGRPIMRINKNSNFQIEEFG